jgi:isopentenyldiphosphate isomerase
MTDELVDIINDRNEVIGQAVKSEVHQKGLRHRVSAVLLQNENGEYLIPTASDKKVEAGHLFHSAAGHVHAGDSYNASACRELWEETGLKAEPGEAKFLGSFWVEKDYPTRKEKERFEVYLIKYLPRMGKIKMNEEQVNEQWLGVDELTELFRKHPEKFSYPLSLTCKHILKIG